MGREDAVQTTQYYAIAGPIGEAYDPLPLLVVLIAAFIFYSRRNLITGTAEVVSGNLIIVDGEKIRLYATYGLMHDQPWIDRNGVMFDGGEISKAALKTKIDGKTVRCWIQPKGGRARGAKVCRVFLDDDDVGEWMVINGYAVADIDPARRNVYLKAQTKAEKKGLIIHQGDFCIPGSGTCSSIRETTKNCESFSTSSNANNWMMIRSTLGTRSKPG